MTSVYKRGRDANKKSAPYFFSFTDEFGKRRHKKGFTDKERTKQLAAKMQGDAHARRTGLIDPQAERLAAQRELLVDPIVDQFENEFKHRRRNEMNGGGQ